MIQLRRGRPGLCVVCGRVLLLLTMNVLQSAVSMVLAIGLQFVLSPACIHSSAALSTQHQFNISDSLSWKQLLSSQFIYNPILLGQIETDAFLPSLQKEFTVKCWTDLHSLA